MQYSDNEEHWSAIYLLFMLRNKLCYFLFSFIQVTIHKNRTFFFYVIELG